MDSLSSVSFPQFDKNVEDKTDKEFKNAEKKSNKKILGKRVVSSKNRQKIKDGHKETMPQLREGRQTTDQGRDSFERAKPMAQAGQQEMSRSLNAVNGGSFSAQGTNGSYTMPSIGMNASINVSSGMGVEAMFGAFSQTQTGQSGLFNAMNLINNDAMKQQQTNSNLMQGVNFYGNLEAKHGREAQGHFQKTEKYMGIAQNMGNVAQTIGRAAQTMEQIAQMLQALGSALSAIPFVGPAIGAALKTAAQVIKVIAQGLSMVAQGIAMVAQQMAQKGMEHMQKGMQSQMQSQMAGMQKQMLQMQLQQGMQTLQQIGNARNNVVNMLGQNMNQQNQLMQMLQGYGYMQGQNIPNAGMFAQGGMFGANNLMGMMGMMGMMSPLMNMMGGMMAQSAGMGMSAMRGQSAQGGGVGFGVSVSASLSPGPAVASMGGFGSGFSGGFQGGQNFARPQAVRAMPAADISPTSRPAVQTQLQPQAQQIRQAQPNGHMDPRQMPQQMMPNQFANAQRMPFGAQNQMGANRNGMNSMAAGANAGRAGAASGSSGKKAQYEKQLTQIANNILSKNSASGTRRTGENGDPAKSQLNQLWMQANKEKVVIDKEVAELVNRALGENKSDKNAGGLDKKASFANGRQPLNQTHMRGNQFGASAANRFMEQNPLQAQQQVSSQIQPQQIQQQAGVPQAPQPQPQPQIPQAFNAPAAPAAAMNTPSVSSRG